MRSFLPLLAGLFVLAPLVMTKASTVQTPSLRGEDIDQQLPLHRQLVQASFGGEMKSYGCRNLKLFTEAEEWKVLEFTHHDMSHYMCAESCRGITNRVGLSFGNTCTCLKNNTDLTKYIGYNVPGTACELACEIRPLGTELLCGGEWFMSIYSIPKEILDPPVQPNTDCFGCWEQLTCDRYDDGLQCHYIPI